MHIVESKRSLYDKWGMDGLKHNGPPPQSTTTTRKSRDFDDFNDFFRASHSSAFHHHDPFNFHFKSPFDVFKDFFGGRDPFQVVLILSYSSSSRLDPISYVAGFYVRRSVQALQFFPRSF